MSQSLSVSKLRVKTPRFLSELLFISSSADQSEPILTLGSWLLSAGDGVEVILSMFELRLSVSPSVWSLYFQKICTLNSTVSTIGLKVEHITSHHITTHRRSGSGSGHNGLDQNQAGSCQFDMKTSRTRHGTGWLTGGRGAVWSHYVSVTVLYRLSIPVSWILIFYNNISKESSKKHFVNNKFI